MRSLTALLAGTAALAVASPALAQNELRDWALEMFSPVPATIPALEDNIVTPEKI